MFGRACLYLLILSSARVAFALAPNEVHLQTSAKLFNTPLVTVTICTPGTKSCQTIDNIQLDTGSTGLRIYRHAHLNIRLPSAKVSRQETYECVIFVDGTTHWGSVKNADVYIGGEVAKNLRIQVSDRARPGVACDGSENGPKNFNTNGVLGINAMKYDASVTHFICGQSKTSSCSPIDWYARAAMLVNPIYKFAVDNNGFSIEFPAVSEPKTAVAGVMTFGINTQSNNQLDDSAPRFDAAETGSIKVKYVDGQIRDAYIDSGSAPIEVPRDPNIALCAFRNFKLRCPSQVKSVPITLVGKRPLNFNIQSSRLHLIQGTQIPVFHHPVNPNLVFSSDYPKVILGLPFFFGKKIVFGFASQTYGKYVAIQQSE